MGNLKELVKKHEERAKHAQQPKQKKEKKVEPKENFEVFFEINSWGGNVIANMFTSYKRGTPKEVIQSDFEKWRDREIEEIESYWRYVEEE